MKDAISAFFVWLQNAHKAVQISVGVAFVVVLAFTWVMKSSITDLIDPKNEKASPAYQKAKTKAKPSDYNPALGQEKPAGLLSLDSGKNQKTDEATQQLRAGYWHGRHKGLRDPEKKFIQGPIGPLDQESFVAYEFYANDRCLHIMRQINGKETDKWIADVVPPEHIHEEDNTTKNTRTNPDDVRQAVTESFGSDLLKKLIPSIPHVQAAMQDGPQFCQNPHGGTYQWFWGPANGCFQPQYRVFYDGCKHYQVFNSCAGVWLPDINWTYCRPH